MPRNKISDTVEGRILQLLHQGYSQPRIVNILKLDGINVARSTLSNVKRKIGRQRNSRSKIKIFRKKSALATKTALHFVEPGAKINSNYSITNILQPFLSRDVPRLFPRKEEIKWFFHQDSAPSHTSKETVDYLNKCKINFIKPEEWMPSSPDAAPMDCYTGTSETTTK